MKGHKVKIVFWDRGAFQKHKKTVIGTIVKDAPQDLVIDIGSNAIIIPHRDILHIEFIHKGQKNER